MSMAFSSRVCWFSGLIFVCAGIFVGRQCYEAVGGDDQPASAVLQRTQWNFGEVTAGPVLRAKFPLRNSGARRLIVMEKSRSCECVSGSRREIILEPGESTELEAVLQTRGLRSNVRLELDYTTSDPQLPQFRLTVIADIISPSPKVR